MECNRHNLLSFWTVFCPFTPLWTQKIKILKKLKKQTNNNNNKTKRKKTNKTNKQKTEDIIILQICTMNDSHMMYGSRDRIFHDFGPFFALLHPIITPNHNFEKMKKSPGEIIILHMCTINDNHMMYGSWDGAWQT